MSNWRLLDESTMEAVPLTVAREDMTTFVKKNMNETDWGGPADEQGYSLIISGSEIPSENNTPQTIGISLTAGSTWRNSVTFQIGWPTLPKDYELITYPIYKAALEVIAANWSCPWLLTKFYSGASAPVDTTMEVRKKAISAFEVAWIAYLSPRLAAGLAPPAELTCERTPGGGMVLGAVQGLIDQSNPDHMRRSRMLETILEDRIGQERRTPAQLPARIGPY